MTKLKNLIAWFEDKGRVMVSLSGGVDSGLVAFAAFEKLRDSAIAVTADYQTLSKEELKNAKQIASEIGIKHVVVKYNELENKNFIQNDNKRCYYCRTELALHLKKLSTIHQIQTIVDGTNVDDLGDYRPGISALKENCIRSPLVETGFTKKEIRSDAKNLRLSFHDKPSNSCLASRIPWGQRVTAEKLARIEVGELFIKQSIKTKQVRVRDINGVAKIEIDRESLKQISNTLILDKLNSKLRQIGFTSITIDPEGYSPGKINVMAD